MTFFSTLRIALVLAALLLIASPAQAYLDPGTGSMLISAVIGVVAAAGLGLKMFWYRVVGLFRGIKGGSQPGETEGAPPAKE
jgi:hypothetical protein